MSISTSDLCLPGILPELIEQILSNVPFKQNDLVNYGPSSNSFLQLFKIAVKAQHILYLLISWEVLGLPLSLYGEGGIRKARSINQQVRLCRKHMGWTEIDGPL